MSDFEKMSNFGLEDEERPGQPKKFEDEEMEALLDEDCCQAQKELAESLGVTQAAISKRSKAAGYIQKQGNWVRHEFKPRHVERRFCMSEMLLERQKRSHFCIGLLLVMKNGSITTTSSAKNDM